MVCSSAGQDNEQRNLMLLQKLCTDYKADLSEIFVPIHQSTQWVSVAVASVYLYISTKCVRSFVVLHRKPKVYFPLKGYYLNFQLPIVLPHQ